MRRRSLAVLVGIAFGGLAANQMALAADLPRKAPAYVAPQPPPFTWTGFYGGIHAGYGWSNSTADVVVVPAVAFDPASLNQNGKGVIGGGQIGYNWQFAPNFVIGVEGDISGTGIHKTTSNRLTLPASVRLGPIWLSATSGGWRRRERAWDMRQTVGSFM